MAIPPGARLGPYEVVSSLGAGGMGEVYRAKDTRLDRTVAVKVLPEHLAHDPDLRQRFEREARAVSSLNHPHICVLHDVGRQDGVDYLVLEYLEGESLHDRLEQGPLPLDQAPLLDRDRRCPRQGPPLGCDPPRPQARQRDADEGGSEAPGLRPGQEGGARREGGCGPFRPGHPGEAADRERDATGDGAVHGAGADRGAGGGCADGHLGPGSLDLRDGDGEAGIRGDGSGEPDRGDPEGRAAADAGAEAGGAAFPGTAGEDVPGQDPTSAGRAPTTSSPSCAGSPNQAPRRGSSPGAARAPRRWLLSTIAAAFVLAAFGIVRHGRAVAPSPRRMEFSIALPAHDLG
jgi:hypothetical protein